MQGGKGGIWLPAHSGPSGTVQLQVEEKTFKAHNRAAVNLPPHPPEGPYFFLPLPTEAREPRNLHPHSLPPQRLGGGTTRWKAFSLTPKGDKDQKTRGDSVMIRVLSSPRGSRRQDLVSSPLFLPRRMENAKNPGAHVNPPTALRRADTGAWPAAGKIALFCSGQWMGCSLRTSGTASWCQQPW